MYDLLFNKLAPIIMIAIGYYWKKKEFPYNEDMLTSKVLNLGAPALLIAAINKKELTLDNMGTILFFGTILILICALIAAIYLKIESKPIRPFLQSFIFPNAGSLGIPIAYILLGEVAFVYALTFSTLMKMLHYTIGLWLANNTFNLKTALKTPVLYAFILAVLLKGTDTKVPYVIEEVSRMLGGMVIPLMLIAFGTTLAKIKIGNNLKALRMGSVRVLLGFTVAYIFLSYINLDHTIAYTLIIQYSMPIATTSYLFALRFNGPSDEIAIMTASSVITILILLPAIVYIL